MRKILMCTIFGVLLVFGAGKENLFAQRGSVQAEILEVKVASPLPRESPWGRTLDRIASEWARITNNQVRLRVLHGGTEGSEAKMHLSLASNTIQAAVFTSFGLNAIDPIVMTMSAPFLIRTEAELTEVMKEVQGDLEARLNRGDYFLVAWSKAGFVNIFSKDPVFTPDDLKRQRIASNAEAEDMNTAFKTMGFQVVESDWSDVGPKLATGAVMAIYQQPAAVAAFQLHTQLKNMLSINVAPVLGGIVINQVTWRRIGAMNSRYQQELMRVTRQIADDFDKTIQKTVSDAMTTMKRGGLKENVPTAAQAQLWYNEVDRVVPALVGTTFDRDLYNRINNILTRYRGRR